MAKARPERRGAMDRMLTLELVRVTERAAIAAATARGRGDEQRRRPGGGRGDVERAEPARCARPHRRRRGGARRGAEALRRRGGRNGGGAGGRYRRRPARRPHALRQEPAELACRDRRHAARRASQCARRLHGEDRHRARAIRPTSSISTCRRRRRSSGSPRRRASSRRTSPPASSTARAMQR